MLVHRLFFKNLDSDNIIYVLDCELCKSCLTKNELQILTDLELSISNMFNILPLKKDYLKNNVIENKDNKIIGPIKSFKSVFNTTTTSLINKNSQINQYANITYFEKFTIIGKDLDYDSMLQEEYNPTKLIFNNIEDIDVKINFDALIEFNLSDKDIITQLKSYGISFDKQELEYYKRVYSDLERNPNLIELFDLCQSNSEHSRHWFFNGKYNVDNEVINKSLFKLVKETLDHDSNTLVAFSDNSSVIKGDNTQSLKVDSNGMFLFESEEVNLVLTAETHNFPTLICPFQGASTGVGGRIRDNHSTGRGARIQQSIAGYCVGNINRTHSLFNTPYLTPIDMLVEASNGASDYGNKIGEPIVGGFTRGIGDIKIHGKFYEYLKPIMFSAGTGTISSQNLYKNTPCGGDLVIRLGGPVYKIGLGGGFNSSIDNKSEMTQSCRDAVQRGDPQMENKLNRVITRLCNLNEKNPINSIHDQGAGGLANVLKEIVYPNGANLNLDNVTLGDNSLGPLEIWCSEFQESSVILINPEFNNIQLVSRICSEENVIADFVGTVYSKDDENYGNAQVFYKSQKIVDFPLEPILDPCIRKEYILSRNENETQFLGAQPDTLVNNNDTHSKLSQYIDYVFLMNLGKLVLSDLDVCSKRFLTTKVDRSVTGLVARQQCVGPLGIPISNYSANMLSFNDVKGSCSSVGERPLLGLFSEKLQAQYTLAEMLTNLSGAYIENIDKIKCSVNWMWANKSIGESRKLYNVAKELTNSMKMIGVGIDGGKDSLSMSVGISNKDPLFNEVVSPGNVVATSYAYTPNINKCLTPDCKDTISIIVYIPFTNYSFKFQKENTTLLGSILWKKINEISQTNNSKLNTSELRELLKNTELPSEIDFNYVKTVFNYIQDMLGKSKIQSLHDVGDGGLFTTLFEMAYSGYKGISIFSNVENEIQFINTLFSEEPGIVLEISNNDWIDDIRSTLNDLNIPYKLIGWTKKTLELSFEIRIKSNNSVKNINLPLCDFVESYESLATDIELKQCNKEQVIQESNHINNRFIDSENEFSYVSNPVDWFIPKIIIDKLKNKTETFNKHLINLHNTIDTIVNNHTVLIIRDEGSNGDMEMGAFFKQGGFKVLNYNHNMLESNIEILKSVDGIVFVGGFTFSDIMGSATCWATRIKNNHALHESLLIFFNNINKFVLGVCNGFQLLIKLGVFGDNIDLVQNDSKRFESRFTKILVDFNEVNRCEINPGNIYFKDMNETSFGMWSAHGEGKLVFTDEEINKNKFIPILKYANNFPCNDDSEDEDLDIPLNYPQNPNGSFKNTAGVITTDGRILGLMPHFERSFLINQCAYVPQEYSNLHLRYSPWSIISENLQQFLNTPFTPI
jgi:phosphoribosylformylglycinamidine synthase